MTTNGTSIIAVNTQGQAEVHETEAFLRGVKARQAVNSAASHIADGAKWVAGGVASGAAVTVETVGSGLGAAKDFVRGFFS